MKIMVRNRQLRKSTIGMFTEESMKEAAVINGGVSKRGAAERMGVAKSTFILSVAKSTHKYVKKIKRTDGSEIKKKKGFDRIIHVVKFSTKMKKII